MWKKFFFFAVYGFISIPTRLLVAGDSELLDVIRMEGNETECILMLTRERFLGSDSLYALYFNLSS